MIGWIKLHRKFLTWEWYLNSNMVHLFLHILLTANHEPGRWQGIEIQRGQLITGRKKLSQQTGISEKSIRTCLKNLKNTGELAIKTANKYSIITVCNYDSYQIEEIEAGQQTGQQGASKGPAKGHKQEGKEGEEGKENKKRDKRVKKFTPPSLDEFKDYFREKGFKTSVAERAWQGYEVADWYDSEGKPIINWKQKCFHVWFKEEHRINGQGRKPKLAI